MSARRPLASQTRDAVVLLRRFGQWWGRELSATVPAGLRRRFDGRGSRLIIMAEPAQAVFLLENGKAPERLGTIDLAPERDAAADVRTLLRKRRLSRRIASRNIETCVRIPQSCALRTTIALPLAAEGNLDEVVSFELDRHTPFQAEQVYFSARVTMRDGPSKRLTAEVTLVPRSVANEALSLVGDRLGLPADCLDIGSADGRAATGNLLPPPRTASQGIAGLLVPALTAAAACLALLAIYLPVARMEREAETTAGEFASVRAAVALQRQIDELKKEQRFLVDKKAEAPMVSKLLLETTHLLPDDTSLSSWQLSGTEVQFGGTARSAASLILLLERSRVFRDTGFRTPVTQDPVSGRETFYIAAQAVAGVP